jgi:hypothetical protein
MSKYIVFHVDHTNGKMMYLKYEQNTHQLYARASVSEQWVHYMDLAEVSKENGMWLVGVSHQIDVKNLVKHMDSMDLINRDQLMQTKMDMYVRIKKEYIGNGSSIHI